MTSVGSRKILRAHNARPKIKNKKKKKKKERPCDSLGGRVLFNKASQNGFSRLIAIATRRTTVRPTSRDVVSMLVEYVVVTFPAASAHYEGRDLLRGRSVRFGVLDRAETHAQHRVSLLMPKEDALRGGRVHVERGAAMVASLPPPSAFGQSLLARKEFVNKLAFGDGHGRRSIGWCATISAAELLQPLPPGGDGASLHALGVRSFVRGGVFFFFVRLWTFRFFFLGRGCVGIFLYFSCFIFFGDSRRIRNESRGGESLVGRFLWLSPGTKKKRKE
jgi:hypothetical protein